MYMTRFMPNSVIRALSGLLFGLLFTTPALAQLIVQGGLTAQQLAEVIAGPGITVTNATITGAPVAYGTFDGSNSAIGLQSGVLLTTGSIDLAVGPNNSGSAGVDNGMPGHPMLESLAGAQTFDAVVLEFDFVPLSNTAQFRYVFGSEEYPEFVNSGFNDAFAFFISGPGIAATYGVANYNMARVPGTTLPVTIDNVNANTNSQYYISNSAPLFGTAPFDFQYDGVTVVLTATAEVQACETYHLMLMIADGGDGIYDSGVFIEENSLISNVVQIEATTANADSIAYEGCTSATVTFILDNTPTTDYTINYTVGGTATNGVDYNLLPGSITIPAGQTSASFVVTPVEDGITEGIETVIISLQTSVCGTDEIIIYIDDLVPLEIEAFGDTSFCPGGTAMLWATTTGGGGGNSFQWSNGATTDTIYVTPVQETTYTVSATDFCASGNPTSNPVTVSFDLLPLTITAHADTGICPGETAMLWMTSEGGGGIATLNWSNGATTDTIYVSPATTQSYTVSGTGNCSAGVTESDPVTVTVYPQPAANAGPDIIYCTGDDVTLTGSGGIAYQWFGLPEMTPLGTDATLNLSPIGDFDLMLVVANGGCSDTDHVSVTELPADPVTAQGAAIICPNEQTQLNVTGAAAGSTYAWSPATGLSDVTAQDPMAAPVQTTFYHVEVTSPNGCIGRDSVEVTVRPLPVPSFTASAACLGEMTMFTSTSSAGVGSIAQHYWQFGDWETSAQTSPSHGYESAGDYTVQLTVTTDEGCVDSTSSIISVGHIPVAGFTFDNDCQDKLIAFADNSAIASGTVTGWLWAFGNGQVSDQQYPPVQEYPAAGFFDVTLTVTSDAGCSHDTAHTLEVYPLPTAIFTWDSVCRGLPNQFTDLSVANGPYAIIGHEWLFSDGQISDATDPQMLFSTAGQYSATLTVTTAMGCQHTRTDGNAAVHPLPVAQFSNSIANCLHDSTYFEDHSTVQNLLGDVIAGRTWDFGYGYGSTSATPVHLFAEDGFHPVQLDVVTDKGCTGTVTHDVEIYPLPEVAFSSDIREGCQPLRIQFLDQSTIPPPYTLAQWQWDFGDGQDSVMTQFPVNIYNDGNIAPLDAAYYTVGLRVTSGKGCKSSFTFDDYITEHPKPSAFFDAAPPVVDMNNPRVRFTDHSSINVNSWDWHFGDGATSFAQHTEHTYLDTGSYPVTLVTATAFGCLDTAQTLVKVRPTFTFYIPNTFTPNSDVHNEFFFGQGTGIAGYSMMIFDRWGQMIFESNDIDFKWDGTFRGTQVQLGVYQYLFTVVDWEGNYHHYKGHVNLIR